MGSGRQEWHAELYRIAQEVSFELSTILLVLALTCARDLSKQTLLSAILEWNDVYARVYAVDITRSWNVCCMINSLTNRASG
jgi:hypothetical protein